MLQLCSRAASQLRATQGAAGVAGPALTRHGLRRVQQEAELRPKRAQVQQLEDAALVLSQELDRITKEQQALDAAQEKARAEALESLTEHGQVRVLLTVTVHNP